MTTWVFEMHVSRESEYLVWDHAEDDPALCRMTATPCEREGLEFGKPEYYYRWGGFEKTYRTERGARNFASRMLEKTRKAGE